MSYFEEVQLPGMAPRIFNYFPSLCRTWRFSTDVQNLQSQDRSINKRQICGTLIPLGTTLDGLLLLLTTQFVGELLRDKRRFFIWRANIQYTPRNYVIKSVSFIYHSNRYTSVRVPVVVRIFGLIQTGQVARTASYYLLTHSIVQSPSWEANWFAASQEIHCISRNPKVHYRTHKRPPLKKSRMWVFLNKVFNREVLLAPRPTPKLEDHPLSAVRDCLFNLFAATLLIGGRSSIRNLRTRHAVVTGNHYTAQPLIQWVKLPGACCVHPLSFTADIKETIQVALCSPSGTCWPVLCWINVVRSTDPIKTFGNN